MEKKDNALMYIIIFLIIIVLWKPLGLQTIFGPETLEFAGKTWQVSKEIPEDYDKYGRLVTIGSVSYEVTPQEELKATLKSDSRSDKWISLGGDTILEMKTQVDWEKIESIQVRYDITGSLTLKGHSGISLEIKVGEEVIDSASFGDSEGGVTGSKTVYIKPIGRTGDLKIKMVTWSSYEKAYLLGHSIATFKIDATFNEVEPEEPEVEPEVEPVEPEEPEVEPEEPEVPGEEPAEEEVPEEEPAEEELIEEETVTEPRLPEAEEPQIIIKEVEKEFPTWMKIGFILLILLILYGIWRK